ncbi:hypothetical protein EVAR_19059_1 [Eumeta japonica]|uniref:Uncharacterized protein n=1 Tax=Eumeta variegata TaxID=151549 RepID=A0A4C1UP19_EUMVA|nr:hypothetical protein EVAR_19059_1 [Eumeta japonica]
MMKVNPTARKSLQDLTAPINTTEYSSFGQIMRKQRQKRVGTTQGAVDPAEPKDSLRNEPLSRAACVSPRPAAERAFYSEIHPKKKNLSSTFNNSLSHTGEFYACAAVLSTGLFVVRSTELTAAPRIPDEMNQHVSDPSADTRDALRGADGRPRPPHIARCDNSEAGYLSAGRRCAGIVDLISLRGEIYRTPPFYWRLFIKSFREVGRRTGAPRAPAGSERRAFVSDLRPMRQFETEN